VRFTVTFSFFFPVLIFASLSSPSCSRLIILYILLPDIDPGFVRFTVTAENVEPIRSGVTESKHKTGKKERAIKQEQQWKEHLSLLYAVLCWFQTQSKIMKTEQKAKTDLFSHSLFALHTWWLDLWFSCAVV
jgi:hypothetical protein